MSYFDLQIITNELQSQITNYRLANIYDLLNATGFLLKFAVPDSKKLLIVNPGFQIHLTDFTRDTTPTPGNFVTKLRKHLKTRRLKRVALAKNDRVLVFSFSDTYSFHLVFEFHSGGNIILLDEQFRIMSLLKTVAQEKTSLAPTDKYAVGSTYDVNSLLEKDTDEENVSVSDIKEWLAGVDPATPKRKKKSLLLRNFLYAKLPQLSSSLLEEYLIKFETDPDVLVTALDTSEDSLQAVVNAVNATFKAAKDLITAEQTVGYIVTEKNPQFTGTSSEPSEYVEPLPITQAGTFVDPRQIEFLYTDYQPFKPSSTTLNPLVKLESFNKTIDYYYSTIEASKSSLKVLNKEQALERRLQAARHEKDKRLEGLTEVQERSQRLGLALQENSERVEAAAQAVRDQIDQKMDWNDIEQLIKSEQARKNPVAQMIALPLDLKENKIKVILPDPDFEESESESDSGSESENESSSDSEIDDENETKSEEKKPKIRRTVKVAIDLSLTAWANSRTYFDQKRTAAAKQERTLQSANKALKSAEHKILRDIAASRAQDNQSHGLRSVRETYWFEKFYWFVSSDGYLVLGGRDTMQSQLLFRRYFKQYDVLATADVPGASIVIVKNHLGEANPEVPPNTISQAGAFAAASSTKAWESKMIPRSWYGLYDQIDKVNKETGQLVPIDNIEVRNGRNVIPPMPMDMGLGFMWLVKKDGQEDDQEVNASDNEKEIEDSKIEEKGRDEEETKGEDQGNESDSNSDSDSDSDDDFFPDTQLPDSISAMAANAPEPQPESEEPTPTSTAPASGLNTPLSHAVDADIAESDMSLKRLALDGKKRLSAKERRDLRKKKDTADDEEEDDSDNYSPPNSIALDIEKRMEMLSGAGKKKSGESTQQPPKVRGKKSKLKKLATKYADQDEEERRAKLEKIGAIKSAGSGPTKKEKEQEARERQKQQEALRKVRQKRAEEAELKKILDFDEDEDLSALAHPKDVLVNRLKAGDVAVAAVPVFGTWSAITKLKYKIKFLPGNTKKGKAIKEIVHGISQAKVDNTSQDPDFAWPEEINLIKGLRPSEIAMPIAVSKVAFHMPTVTSGAKSTSSKSGAKSGGGGGGAKGKGGSKGKGGKRK